MLQWKQLISFLLGPFPSSFFPFRPLDYRPNSTQAFTLSHVLSFGYIGIGSFDLLNLQSTLNPIQADKNRSNGQLLSFFTPNGQLRCPWRAHKRFGEAPGVDAAAIVVAASTGVSEQADIYSFGMLCIGRVGAFSPSPISSSSFSCPFKIRVDMRACMQSHGSSMWPCATRFAHTHTHIHRMAIIARWLSWWPLIAALPCRYCCGWPKSLRTNLFTIKFRSNNNGCWIDEAMCYFD